MSTAHYGVGLWWINFSYINIIMRIIIYLYIIWTIMLQIVSTFYYARGHDVWNIYLINRSSDFVNNQYQNVLSLMEATVANRCLKYQKHCKRVVETLISIPTRSSGHLIHHRNIALLESGIIYSCSSSLSSR